MLVFISWSGELSLHIAETLNKWIPYILPTIECFFSADCIEKGEKWNSYLENALCKAKFGIVCLTKENVNEPWILFESGALVSGKGKKLTTLLVGLEPEEITGPLSFFQATKFEKKDFQRLLESINHHNGNMMNSDNIAQGLERFWPIISSEIENHLRAYKCQKQLRSGKREIINSKELIELILKEAGESFLYPEASFKIRVVIVSCNYEENIRTTIYSYNARPDPEKVSVYPLDFGVIGQCLKKKAAVFCKLPQNHLETYDKEISEKITPELWGIIAAPIFRYNDPQYTIDAVLAFDLIETSKEHVNLSYESFNRRQVLEIAQSWADILSFLIDLNGDACLG